MSPNLKKLTKQTNALKEKDTVGDGILSPVPPPGELNETYASSFIRAYTLHYTET